MKFSTGKKLFLKNKLTYIDIDIELPDGKEYCLQSF